MEWEFFCDEAYYHNWAVRPAGEKTWGVCFHLNSREEAEGLCKLLTDNKVPSPFTEATQ